MGYYWHKDSLERAAKEKTQEIEHEAHVEDTGRAMDRREYLIEKLGIKPTVEVVVDTTEGPQKGIVDSLDDTGRIWVRGIDTERGFPLKPVLCSPDSIVSVNGVQREEIAEQEQEKEKLES